MKLAVEETRRAAKAGHNGIVWTSAPQALPMDNTPGRVGQLLVDMKIWAAKTFN